MQCDHTIYIYLDTSAGYPYHKWLYPTLGHI